MLVLLPAVELMWGTCSPGSFDEYEGLKLYFGGDTPTVTARRGSCLREGSSATFRFVSICRKYHLSPVAPRRLAAFWHSRFIPREDDLPFSKQRMQAKLSEALYFLPPKSEATLADRVKEDKRTRPSFTLMCSWGRRHLRLQRSLNLRWSTMSSSSGFTNVGTSTSTFFPAFAFHWDFIELVASHEPSTIISCSHRPYSKSRPTPALVKADCRATHLASSSLSSSSKRITSSRSCSGTATYRHFSLTAEKLCSCRSVHSRVIIAYPWELSPPCQAVECDALPLSILKAIPTKLQSWSQLEPRAKAWPVAQCHMQWTCRCGWTH